MIYLSTVFIKKSVKGIFLINVLEHWFISDYLDLMVCDLVKEDIQC